MINSPLFNEIKQYLARSTSEKQIFVYVPFIKVSILERLIEGLQNKIIIITNWSKRNLIAGSSELELYPFCKERNIALYHNERLHLKVYSVNLEDLILATGNISQRGLMPEGNFELGISVKQISIKDRLYLEQIRKNSILINDKIFEILENWTKYNPPNPPKDEKFPEIENAITKDQFLISALPMTKEVRILQESYDKLNHVGMASDDEEINACVYHDLVNYGIPLGLSRDEFQNVLKKKFFEHPFIQKIDGFIDPEAYFGTVKEWIQKNCTDVPVPSRRELTGNVQVLYDWFEKLGDGKYVIDVPGSHSQRIRKIVPDLTKEDIRYENAVLQVLATPGYTIKEIESQYQKTGRNIHKNLDEEENRAKPIWHYKSEMDQKVKEMVGNDKIPDKSYPSGKTKFYNDIVHVISHLYYQGFIVFWYHSGDVGRGATSDGIWRLSQKGREEVIRRELPKP